MTIEIAPFDTLFFRDGRPFSLGEETWADGIFPPLPSSIYGALRTAYFAQNGEAIAKANTTDDPTQNLNILHYCLFCEGKFCYPLPLDLVHLKEISERDKMEEARKNRFKVFLLSLMKNEFVSSKSYLPYLLSSEKFVESLEQGYISQISLEQYLHGLEYEFDAFKIDRYITSEPKIGIARDDRLHTTQEGRLYRVDMKRATNLTLVVEFEGLEKLNPTGFMKLGGEGKVVHYREGSIPKIQQPEVKNKRFKLYLATPGLLKNGWLPAWIDPDTLEGIYPETQVRVKLITAAVGKHLYVGGFDMKEKKPKAMRRAVPAGSVYYFEVMDDVAEDQWKLIKSVRFCDYDDLRKEGFGLTFLGVVE